GAVTKKCVAGPTTVRSVEPLTVPALAVMVVVPGDASAKPLLPTSLVMEATPVFDESQVIEASVWAGPLVNVPVAPKRWNDPTAIVGLAGVTVIAVSPGGGEVLGVNNSELARASPLDTLKLWSALSPPVIRILPMFSSVAV